jgi:hypothetical protein
MIRDRPISGCSSMVEQQPSKLNTRVRFPSPAPMFSGTSGITGFPFGQAYRCSFGQMSVMRSQSTTLLGVIHVASFARRMSPSIPILVNPPSLKDRNDSASRRSAALDGVRFCREFGIDRHAGVVEQEFNSFAAYSLLPWIDSSPDIAR